MTRADLVRMWTALEGQRLNQRLRTHVATEVVVDATNRLYIPFGKALAAALRKARGQLPATEAERDDFVTAMVMSLSNACTELVMFCVAAGAEHIVFALDEPKAGLNLLRKWRETPFDANAAIVGKARRTLRALSLIVSRERPTGSANGRHVRPAKPPAPRYRCWRTCCMPPQPGSRCFAS